MIARAPIVAARGLAKRYGRRPALTACDLDVHAGEALALIGPNGAGKTTLLSLLAGALAPSAGSIVRPADERTGWVPQRPALYRRLSARENLRLFAGLERIADADAACARLLRVVDLEAAADQPVERLSVGNAQRLNVAIGLLGDPEVVFLDEPTAALDPRQRLSLWAILHDVTARGGACVFATQNVEEAHLHADRLAVLLDGAIVFCGPQDEFWERAGVDGRDGGFERAFVAFIDAAEGHGGARP